ncbi:phage tail tube protein [Cumulibacter soli]|uniref:phage tail tube protein n=1 Tax=Cumulibacter soli TaxID=2546344 RepID=UPI0010685598|nr:hypothetical protein [Cumulibacter soli]
MTAPLPQQTGKELAREYKLEINTGDAETPVWAAVPGLQSNTLTVDGTEVDATDMDSEGWDSKFIVGRAWAIACDGTKTFTKAADGSRTYNAAQALLEEKANAIGDEAQILVRRTNRVTGAGFMGWANVHLRTRGADKASLNPFNLELSGDGEMVLIPATEPETP